jgi:putative endonuclease
MTDNLERRLSEHNGHEKNTITTMKLGDYKLIFCQIVQTRLDARKLEKFLKSGYGREIRNEIVQYTHKDP